MTALPVFNPFDPAFRVDPYPTYARLRDENPVHETQSGALVFSRYDDCIALLRDPRSSSDGRNSTDFALAVERGEIDPAVAEDGNPSFLFLDPPDHTRLRGLVSKAFTPRLVEGLRPRIQERVDELLDAVVDSGSIEIIEDLAYPLPVVVICEMLGVPVEDHVTFKEWSRAAARSLDPVEALPPDVQQEREETRGKFGEYFSNLIAKRRADPKDDLISALIAAEDEGHRLNEVEILTTCTLLLIAGHETTVNLIGNGTLALLRNPDELDKLRADPSLAQDAVEEVLRYDPPVQFTGRVALEEMEVGGATLMKGQQSVILLASANRDAAQFQNPDEFDITRQDNQQIAFSYGLHYCLGAPLARVEGQIALRTLVSRFDGLALQNEAPQYKENIVLRGLDSLQVAFRPGLKTPA